jgi:large subunit ribosomal protein L9
MKVYLKADIRGVGMTGEIITVSDGYARNYLFPRKYAIEITSDNEKLYTAKRREVDNRKEVIATQTSMLADRIEGLSVTIRRKVHDGGKLYGSVSEADIADGLKKEGIAIAKNQIVIEKSIREKGAHTVVVKLSSRLQPKLKVLVVAENTSGATTVDTNVAAAR